MAICQTKRKKMDWEQSYIGNLANSLITSTVDEAAFSKAMIELPSTTPFQSPTNPNFALDFSPINSASSLPAEYSPLPLPLNLLSVTADASHIMRTELATNLFVINTPYLHLRDKFPLTIQLKSQKKGTLVKLERVSCSYYSNGGLVTFTIGKKGYNDEEFKLQILQDRTIIAEVNKIKLVSHGIPSELISYRDFVFDFSTSPHFSKMDHFVDVVSQKKCSSKAGAKRKSNKFRCEYGNYPHFQESSVALSISGEVIIDETLKEQKVVKEQIEQVERLIRTMTSRFIKIVNTEAEAVRADKTKLEQIKQDMNELEKILESMQEQDGSSRSMSIHTMSAHIERASSVQAVRNDTQTSSSIRELFTYMGLEASHTISDCIGVSGLVPPTNAGSNWGLVTDLSSSVSSNGVSQDAGTNEIIPKQCVINTSDSPESFNFEIDPSEASEFANELPSEEAKYLRLKVDFFLLEKNCETLQRANEHLQKEVTRLEKELERYQRKERPPKERRYLN